MGVCTQTHADTGQHITNWKLETTYTSLTRHVPTSVHLQYLCVCVLGGGGRGVIRGGYITRREGREFRERVCGPNKSNLYIVIIVACLWRGWGHVKDIPLIILGLG